MGNHPLPPHFQQLVAKSQEWLWETDPAGNLIHCMPNCEELYGYRQEELIGRRHFSFLLPEHEKKHARILFSDQKDKTAVSSHAHSIQHADGAVLQVETHCLPLFVQSTLFGFCGLTRNVTAQLEIALRLQEKTRELNEVNNALKALLQQSSEAMASHDRTIYENLRRLVFPYLEKLKAKNNNPELDLYIDVVQANLEKINSTFTATISSHLTGLTPRELQIAELIKQGKTTKEMAALLEISSRTVEFYRDKVRLKLGLKNRKMNLRSRLSSLT